MFLLWGKELLSFYNDAYRPTLGTDGKHPYALGKPGKEVWPEAWLAVKPLIDQVLSGGEAIWLEDQLIPIYRNGSMEEVYWTFSYSPVLDESGLPAGVFIMCSETTKTFKGLKESEAQLQFAVEAAELATWDFNPITNTFTANARYTEWFGIPAANETDNALALRVIADEDRERVIAAYTKALDYASGSSYDIEYTIRPNGRPERILRAKGKAWFNEQNSAYRFNGTLQDVTKEARARQELTDKKQSLELAIEIGELGIFNIDVYTNKATYSQKIMDWFGFTEQHLSLSSIFSKIHPEDRAIVSEIIERSIAGDQNGRHDVMYRIINPNDGQLRHLRSIGQVQFQENAPAHISGIIQDVTEQVLTRKKIEKSEMNFRNLVMQAPVAVAVFRGEDFIVELANDAYLPLVAKGRSELEGKPFFEVLPEIQDIVAPLFRNVMRTGQALPTSELELVLYRNGRNETCYFNSIWEPLRESDGRTTGLMAVVHEITDQVRARKKVEESEAKLRSIIAAAPAGIGLFIGRDLIIEMPNQTFIDIVGKGPDIEGKPLREVMPELITENQPFLQILDDVYTSGTMFQSFGAQVQIVQHGVMTHNYYNITYTPLFDTAGKVYAILDIAVDVTEQVQARKRLEENEQQVRSLVESAPFPIGVFIGREMRIQLANQAIMDAWGKGHNVIGKRYAEVLPELDNQEVFRHLDGVYTTGIPYHAKNQRLELLSTLR